MAANTCNMPPQLFAGSAGVDDYTFGFEYINRIDVEVYVGGSDNWTRFTEGSSSTSNRYEWMNESTIRLNAGGQQVMITRVTDMCDPEVFFYSGTSIKAADLNKNQEQTLFLFQELDGKLFGADGNGIGSQFWNTIASSVTSPIQGQTVKEAETWQSTDTFVATTAAIDKQIDAKLVADTVGEGGKGITIDGKKIVNDIDTAAGLKYSSTDDTAKIQVHLGDGLGFDNDGSIDVTGDFSNWQLNGFDLSPKDPDGASKNVAIGGTDSSADIYLNSNGDATFGGNTSVGGTLGVTGATTLSSTLDVTDATTLSSTLDVTGATVLSSTLNVKNNVDFDQNLNVDGNTQITGNLDVDGATDLDSTLDVASTSTFRDDITLVDSAGDAVIFLDNDHSMTLTGNDSDQFTIDTAADDDLVIGDNRTTNSPTDGDVTIGVLDVQRTLQLDGDNGVIFTGTNSDDSGNYTRFHSPAAYSETMNYSLPSNIPNVSGNFRDRTRFLPTPDPLIAGNSRLIRVASDPFMLRSDSTGTLSWAQLPIAQLADVSELCNPETTGNGQPLIFRANFDPDGTQNDEGEWVPGEMMPQVLRFKGTIRNYSRPYAGRFTEPGAETDNDYLNDISTRVVGGETIGDDVTAGDFWIVSHPVRDDAAADLTWWGNVVTPPAGISNDCQPTNADGRRGWTQVNGTGPNDTPTLENSTISVEFGDMILAGSIFEVTVPAGLPGAGNTISVRNYIKIGNTGGVGIQRLTTTGDVNNGKILLDPSSGDGASVSVSLSEVNGSWDTENVDDWDGNATTIDGEVFSNADIIVDKFGRVRAAQNGEINETPWSKNGTVIHPTVTTDEVAIGGNSLATANHFFYNDSHALFNLTGGNVGIGTNSPIGNLEINSPVVTGVPTLYLNRLANQTDTSDIALMANAVIRSEDSIKNVVNDDGLFTWSIGGTDSKAGTAGATEVVRIDSKGNVGIGNGAPSGQLTVRGTGINKLATILAEADSGTNDSVSTIRLVGTNASGGLSQVSEISCYRPSGGGGTDAALDFKVRKTGDEFATPSHVMTLRGNGNVGIGTTNPTSLLNIKGGVTSSGGVLNNHQLRIQAGDNDSYSGTISWGKKPSDNTYYALAIDALTNNVASDIILAPSGGNVGIGISNPKTKLHVGFGDITLNKNRYLSSNLYYGNGAWRFIEASKSAGYMKLADDNTDGILFTTANGVGGIVDGAAPVVSRFFISAAHGGVGVNSAANSYQGLAVNGNLTNRGDSTTFETISMRCNYDATEASSEIHGVMWRPSWISTANCTNAYGFTCNPGSYSGNGKITNLYGFLATNSIGGGWSATNNFGFYSSVNTTSTAGQSNWNFYAEGSAPNFFKGTIVTEPILFTNNQEQAYLIAGTPNYDPNSDGKSWGTYGFQHKLKSNSGGTGRLCIDCSSSDGPLEAFTIQSGGYVGIGSSNPASKLYIKGDDAAGSRIICERTGGGAGKALVGVDGSGNAAFSTSSAGKGITFYTGDGASTVRASISAGGTFNVKTLAGSGNRNVAADANGNLVIDDDAGGGGAFDDAPSDNKTYGRRNAEWDMCAVDGTNRIGSFAAGQISGTGSISLGGTISGANVDNYIGGTRSGTWQAIGRNVISTGNNDGNDNYNTTIYTFIRIS